MLREGEGVAFIAMGGPGDKPAKSDGALQFAILGLTSLLGGRRRKREKRGREAFIQIAHRGSPTCMCYHLASELTYS